MNRALVALLLAGAFGTAHAAGAIYRCGVDGRIVYSQMPCTDGTLIDAADPRTAAQRAEAMRVAASERKAAAEMERERKKTAANAKPAQATGFDSRPPIVEAAASGASAAVGKVKRVFRVDPARTPAAAASKPAA
jgi:hypothetical protein